MSATSDWFLRPGRRGPEAVRLDILWLLGLGLVLIGAGMGLRDPWPADEPRFALIARDMVATGQWLIPQVGGDLYADKPPLFFWLVGLFLLATGSLRVAFLLPGLLAGLGAVLLIYDLGRRLWSRDVGFVAGLALLATLQFVWEMRQGQIDATLCFFTTLGIYGLLRHLLLGPSWGWYCIGWAAAGLGIITKGVGFLPILLLIPYALARAAGWIQAPTKAGRWKWALGLLAMAGAVSLWLAPMLIAAGGSAELARYRDQILFGQTIGRYAHPWHHTKPFWYFVVNVIPALWLPLVALIPWLWRDWRASWRARDLRVWAPLAWVVLVLLFFSLSSGKRGVYILPAVPAFVLACAPFLPALAQRRGPRNTVFAIACGIVVVAFVGAFLVLFDAGKRQALAAAYDIDVVVPLFAIGAAGAVACALARPVRGFVAYGGVLLACLLIVSFWVNPTIDAARSGVRFIRNVERLAASSEELGLVAYREQYLLHLRRSVVNFGHARWREAHQEAADAAVWLAAKPGRMLLVDQWTREFCFPMATAQNAGQANREQWFLVSGSADAGCAAQGNLGAARTYTPPGAGVRGESPRARTDSTG